MDRRDFLKIASTAGLGVAAASLPFASDASAEQYTGTLWVTINAGGGWDVTSHCDPKGATGVAPGDDPDPMNHYLAKDIGTAGNLKYAPDPDGNNKLFFDKYGPDLMVLNGVDTSTNSHDVGSRVVWSGTLVENKASFAALVAGAYGNSLPMAYITNGGYDVASGVVAVTRVGNIDAVRRIAFPNTIDPLYDQNKTPFYTDETAQRISDMRNARHTAYADRQNLPRIKQSMGMLYTARSGQNELKKLTEYLPAQLENSNLLARRKSPSQHIARASASARTWASAASTRTATTTRSSSSSSPRSGTASTTWSPRRRRPAFGQHRDHGGLRFRPNPRLQQRERQGPLVDHEHAPHGQGHPGQHGHRQDDRPAQPDEHRPGHAPARGRRRPPPEARPRAPRASQARGDQSKPDRAALPDQGEGRARAVWLIVDAK